jgi:hypothetical protein
MNVDMDGLVAGQRFRGRRRVAEAWRRGERGTMLSSMNVDIWMVRLPDEDSVDDGE